VPRQPVRDHLPVHVLPLDLDPSQRAALPITPAPVDRVRLAYSQLGQPVAGLSAECRLPLGGVDPVQPRPVLPVAGGTKSP
jgi:hypothetical protein